MCTAKKMFFLLVALAIADALSAQRTSVKTDTDIIKKVIPCGLKKTHEGEAATPVWFLLYQKTRGGIESQIRISDRDAKVYEKLGYGAFTEKAYIHRNGSITFIEKVK